MREPEIRDTLYQYQQTADELLARADKAVVERVARILALYVGYYQLRHGPIPPTALPTPDEIVSSPEQLADRVEAMRVLAAALAIASAAALDTD